MKRTFEAMKKQVEAGRQRRPSEGDHGALHPPLSYGLSNCWMSRLAQEVAT